VPHATISTLSICSNARVASGRRQPDRTAPRRESSRRRPRLLEDLLLHEVPVRAELDRAERRRDRLTGRSTGAPSRVRIRTPAGVSSTTSPSSRKMKRSVMPASASASDAKVLAVVQADHQRRADARTDQPLRLVLAEHGDRIRAVQLRRRIAHRGEQVAAILLWIRCATTSVSVCPSNS
jgi:hypothetical protein